MVPKQIVAAGITGGMVVLALFGLHFRSEHAHPAEGDSNADSGPFVLELFTSQGCSSCPAAEAVLRKVASDERYASDVIPLAFHVDYWNYLGWEDPYSSTKWTERQSAYMEIMDGATLYTPQLIVHGRHEMVGSDETRIKRVLDDLRRERFGSHLEVTIDNAINLGSHVDVEVSLSDSTDDRGGPLFLVTAVLYENISAFEVPKGENAGRTLRNDFVVRSLFTTEVRSLSEKSPSTFEFTLSSDEEWNTDRMGLAVWVQETETMKILDATVRRELAAR